MTKACPISLKMVDSHIIRVIAIQVSIIAILFLATNLPIFIFILLFDFSIRAFRITKCSPFFMFAKYITKYVYKRPSMSDEAPKRFALFVGLVFSIVIVILYISNLIFYAKVVTTILLVCALLEAMFNYCVGCKVYQVLQQFKRS